VTLRGKQIFQGSISDLNHGLGIRYLIEGSERFFYTVENNLSFGQYLDLKREENNRKAVFQTSSSESNNTTEFSVKAGYDSLFDDI